MPAPLLEDGSRPEVVNRLRRLAELTLLSIVGLVGFSMLVRHATRGAVDAVSTLVVAVTTHDDRKACSTLAQSSNCALALATIKTELPYLEGATTLYDGGWAWHVSGTLQLFVLAQSKDGLRHRVEVSMLAVNDQWTIAAVRDDGVIAAR
ncbi:MAG: hypothetical protein ACHREM_29185 [Polyangiales bacterium]